MNVSATVLVWEMSATVGGYPQQWGDVYDSGGNVHNSGEIENARNLILEIVIYNLA